MKYKAVLFDFDFTLGDSTVPIVAAARGALRGMGAENPPEEEAIRRTVGYSLQDAYTMLTGDPSPAARQTFYDAFRALSADSMIRDTVLLPGALPLLRKLRQAGVRVGVVSTKGRRPLTGIAQKTGMDALLDCIIAGEDVSAPKPDPQGLLAAMRRLGAAPEETLFVGDTCIDAETAQAAGVDFAAVTTGTTPAAAFAAYPSQQVAADLAALEAWLFD